MDALRRFLVDVFGLVFGVVVTITVMIKGWGLTPKLWWWIIGVSIIGHTVSLMIVKAASGDD